MTRSVIEPGTIVGGYTVEALIGRGGMGDVYRAVQHGVARTVALKVLAPTLASEEHFASRFVREAATLGALEHPGIAPVYDAGTADGRLYLAMRLIGSGATLRSVIAQGPLPADRALDVLRGVGAALDHAHGRGVVHRDVKPANILLDDDGRPVLADFGLAKALDDVATTLSSGYLGTPVYLAPEQAAGGPVGHRADLYALACVAFELLTGTPPYVEKDALGLMLAHGSHPIPRATDRLGTLPAALDGVFARALAKSPTDRYTSAAELITALETALVGAAPAASVTGRPTGTAWFRRPRILLVSGVVVATVLAVGVLATRPWRPTATAAASSSAVSSSAVSSSAVSSAAPASSWPPRASAQALTKPAVPVGSKIFEADFANPYDSFYDVVGRGGSPENRTVKYNDGGALTLTALTPNADAGTELHTSLGLPYIVTMSYSVRPGSKVFFDLGLRWAGPGVGYSLRCDTSARSVFILMIKDGKLSSLTPAVTVPGLETGREVQVTVTVDGPHLAVWLDGAKIADLTDRQVPVTAPTIPGLDVIGSPGTGSVRVSHIAFYNPPATTS